MSHPATLSHHTRATWRAVAAACKPMTQAQIERHPSVAAACRRAHDTALRALIRLCDRGHLVHDSAALTLRRYWWGATCLLPAGEVDLPRHLTAADATRALPRTAIDPAASVWRDIATPMRAGGMDFRAHPSRRGDRLHYPDGRVVRLATPVLSTTDVEELEAA